GDGGKLFEIDFTTIDMLIKTMGVSEYMPLIKKLYVDSGAITDQQAEELGDNYTMSALYDKILLSANGDRDAAIDKMIAPLSDFLKDYGLDKDTIMNYINSDYVERLQEIGANTIPSKISIYPASFEAKALIKAYLDAYNEGVENTARQIKYTDLAATVAQSVSQMVDTVSYVLIAFAAISLVVSSVMIAIITYISVLERTKEIGVLRSLGARKIDVANVFNAETLIIGAASGVFGVVVAAILTLPINAIIAKLVNGMVTNIAKLHPLHGILLVVLSMALTVLSGLIPAFMASKRDPVVALRSN
ncbi:MAG: ABC transporter permease, partial [Clostridiales bacterium]|nr:ABC transporter permease [Clostridiales bacterium]